MAKPTKQPTALVVDDDAIVRRLVVRGLEPLGFASVLEADDGEPAKRLLADHDVDVVVTDLLMPDVDGPELIRWANAHRPGSEWIILSGVETFDAAVDAIHLGAFDFLTKPPDVRELRVAVRNALSRRTLVREKERLLARLQESSMELLEKVRELEQKSDRIRTDLRRAEVIQRALLPARPPDVSGVRFESFYRPGKNVGGDLYDVAATASGEIVFYVADATGHGVSAAMLSVLFKQRLTTVDDGGCVVAPSVALQRANHLVARDLCAPGLFLTVVYGVLDPFSGSIVLASAGHPPAAVQRAAGGAVEFFERTGPALGLERVARYGEHRLELRDGDRLALYSDGALAAERGSARAAVSAALGRVAAGESLDRVFVPAAGADRDDRTVLLVEARAGVSRFDNGDEVDLARPRPPAAGTDGPAVVWSRTRGRTMYATLIGRATWPHCDAFFRLARGTLEAGGELALELSDCEHLDSTFLGTVHELVAVGGDRVRVHAPKPSVRALFEELGLDRVLAHTSDDPLELPADLEPLRASATSARESQLRLLRAHETLAELSSENRDKFASIVAALRGDLS